MTSITVAAAGAAGGGGGRPPGLGGLIVATVSVTPLSTLYVYVGSAGTHSGGYNGGGDASSWNGAFGGGGGGASDVRTIEDSQAGSLDSRLVIAGGGGGTALLRLSLRCDSVDAFSYFFHLLWAMLCAIINVSTLR